MPTYPGKQITWGYNYNFFKKVTVTWNTFGGGTDGYAPDLIIPFNSYGVIITNETASTVVQASFNGITTDEEYDPAIFPQGISYSNRALCQIWFKIVAGTSATISVRAWGVR